MLVATEISDNPHKSEIYILCSFKENLCSSHTSRSELLASILTNGFLYLKSMALSVKVKDVQYDKYGVYEPKYKDRFLIVAEATILKASRNVVLSANSPYKNFIR